MHRSHFEQLHAVVPPRQPTGHRGWRPLEEAQEGQRNLGKSSDPQSPGACRAGPQKWRVLLSGGHSQGGGAGAVSPACTGDLCRGRPASALPFRLTVPSAQLQMGVGSRQGSKLTPQPSLPHPSQQSRDDKWGPYMSVVQCGSDDLAVTLQPVLKHRLEKEQSGGQEEKEQPPHGRIFGSCLPSTTLEGRSW